MPHTKQPNQLYREFLGVCGLNPFPGADSSSRVQMFSSHIGQTLVIEHPTPRRIQTGMEQEFGKYTFAVRTPEDLSLEREDQGIKVIKVVERYPATLGTDSIRFSPEQVVIYEDVSNPRRAPHAAHQIGMLTLKRYCSYHQYFGFRYENQPAVTKLKKDQELAPGTVLQDTPNKRPDGDYMYGRECNFALMSMPGVSEDGIVISRDILDRFAFNTFEQRVAEWGNKRIALNLYGDAQTYKPFPDIGEQIRPDGLLMALRTYDENLAIVEQSLQDLREPDFIFDKLIYAAGAGGTVVDIQVHHDGPLDGPNVSPMDVQPVKYERARRKFYQDILGEYRRLKKDRGDALKITPEFQRMVVEAISVVGENKGKRVIKLYRQAPLDEWRVNFVVKYRVVPTIGFKLTDCHGGKGVICHIAEPHEMPVDEAGNRADLVMDPGARWSRMNLGGLYELYINAASRDVTKELRQLFGVTPSLDPHEAVRDPMLLSKVRELRKADPVKFQAAWDYLLGYYQIVTPRQYLFYTRMDAMGQDQHLEAVLKEGVYLYVPTDNEPELPEMVRQLERSYRPTYGPVTYIGNSGRRVITKKPVRIGSLYVILLEKTGDDWTAVSSGKLQHFGVLSQVTNADKFSQPTRNQAIRALGESEVRIYVSYAGPGITADILDRNNNPATHRQILQSILNADKPTNIDEAVDRSVVPLGGSKPLQLVKHIAVVSGWRFIYKPHDPNAPAVPFQGLLNSVIPATLLKRDAQVSVKRVPGLRATKEAYVMEDEEAEES